MRALVLAGLFAAFGLVLAVLYVAIRLLAAYLDRRRARRAVERGAHDPFPAVRLPEDGERPELICLPGGRGRHGRQVYRRVYPGHRWN